MSQTSVTSPTSKRRRPRRPPMVYVWAAIGTAFAVALLLIGWQASRASIHAADQRTAVYAAKLTAVEKGYATLRNQVSALGETPASPSLPDLVGPAFATGIASAPPKQVFKLPGGLNLICLDPTGNAVYTCSEQKITPTNQSPIPTTSP